MGKIEVSNNLHETVYRHIDSMDNETEKFESIPEKVPLNQFSNISKEIGSISSCFKDLN